MGELTTWLESHSDFFDNFNSWLDDFIGIQAAVLGIDVEDIERGYPGYEESEDSAPNLDYTGDEIEGPGSEGETPVPPISDTMPDGKILSDRTDRLVDKFDATFDNREFNDVIDSAFRSLNERYRDRMSQLLKSTIDSAAESVQRPGSQAPWTGNVEVYNSFPNVTNWTEFENSMLTLPGQAKQAFSKFF